MRIYIYIYIYIYTRGEGEAKALHCECVCVCDHTGFSVDTGWLRVYVCEGVGMWQENRQSIFERCSDLKDCIRNVDLLLLYIAQAIT